LSLMYQNLKSKNLGGFYNSYYWSSVESSGEAWYLNFSNGSENFYYKSNSYRVRAVRGFEVWSGE